MAKYVFSNNAKFNWRNMPLLYIYVFQFIAEKAGKFDQEISSKLILEIWHRHIYHIPRVYDFFFLEELEYFGFLKKEKQQKYIFYGSYGKKASDKLDEAAKAMEEDEGEALEVKDQCEAPLLYLYIFSRMLDIFGRENQILTGKQLISVWRKYIPNVARIYDYYILTEMCNFGLIRRLNTQKYFFYGGKALSKLRKLNQLRLW